MKIERVEIFGFKSFMERLVLPLEHGITGVVGPNGCGKSNIIDALRWVLGETRASQLRGGVLEDVIFNGTETLRPLGLAEVSIVVRAERGNLYEDLIGYYEEIESRTPLSTTPSSAQETTSADVLPIRAMENGVDNDDSFDQESKDSIDDENPVAASDALLGDIKASLSKYIWLRGMSEVQVTRRLYRSGESEFFINKVAARLKDLKELFRVIGLAARGYTIIAQGEIGRIVAAKPDDRRQVIEEAAHIGGFRDNMNAVTKRLDDTEAQVIRLDDVITEVSRQVSNLKRQAARATARAELKLELSVAEKQLFTDSLHRLAHKSREGKLKVDSLAVEQHTAQQVFEESRNREREAREGGLQLELEVDTRRRKADGYKQELHNHEREVAREQAKVNELQAVVGARKAEVVRIEDRKKLLAARIAEAKLRVTELESSEGELAQSAAQTAASPEEALKEVTQSLQAARESLRDKERKLREIRDRLVGAQSRRDALSSQLAAASPLNQLKKSLGSNQALPQQLTGEMKLLIDGISVPTRYSKALQAVLAERGSFLVVKDLVQAAQAFSDIVLKGDTGQKQGTAIGLFEERSGITNQIFPEMTAGVSLLSVVTSAPWCDGLLQNFLGKVFVVPTMNDAIAAVKELRTATKVDEEVVIVTEAGDLLSATSLFSMRHEGGVVQLKSRIDESIAQIGVDQTQFDTFAAERDLVANQISTLERRHTELLREVQQVQAKLRELSAKQGEVRGRLQSEQRGLLQAEQDLERLERQLQEVLASAEAITEEAEKAAEKVSFLRSRDTTEIQLALDQVFSELQGFEEKRKILRDTVGQLLRDAELKRSAAESLKERLTRERLAIERLLGERTSVENQVRERLGEEFLTSALQGENFELMAEDLRRELDQRVHSMRQKLEREGEVDPAAIELFSVESARLEELTTQRDDLVKAAETLKTTLGELAEACTTRFISTFEAIRKNFGAYAPKLFGGGSADLVLVNPDDPLQSGVEILVRPPGKKPKSIDLLSGGEKALCATALVFAMFMVRPSPLCVLDEVDAPLDEANVHRFVAFIKEMSARTQFLMVTHNKQSMAAADTLIGVTMPQPGASKVLTVSLQEAERQVA